MLLTLIEALIRALATDAWCKILYISAGISALKSNLSVTPDVKSVIASLAKPAARDS